MRISSVELGLSSILSSSQMILMLTSPSFEFLSFYSIFHFWTFQYVNFARDHSPSDQRKNGSKLISFLPILVNIKNWPSILSSAVNMCVCVCWPADLHLALCLVEFSVCFSCLQNTICLFRYFFLTLIAFHLLLM